MLKNSIAGRLSLMFALASLIFVSVYGLVLRDSLHTSLQNQMHNELLFRANLIEPWIKSRTDGNSWQALTDKLDNLSATEGNRVRYGFHSDNMSVNQELYALSDLQWQNLSDGFSKIPSVDDVNCSTFLYIASIPASENRGAIRYVIAIDSTSYVGTLREFTQILIVSTIFGVVIVAVVGFFIAKIGLKPLKQLSEQTKTLVPSEKGHRLDTLALDDELKDLAASFNDVLDKQEIAWRQLESFNADVAHELRTPLTNLIGQTQLGLAHKHDFNDLQDLLGSNLEELERMTSIVNDMLFLSHAQAGDHATQTSKVSIRNESLKTIEYIEPLLLDKQLEIVVHGDAEARIDHRLYHRALANLLSNSARYAYDNSTVVVEIKRDHKMVSVSVTNEGDPIDTEHLHQLFERFYRLDSSRSSSHIHHGLGLSIVSAVALMHQGTVFATSQNGMNTFGLTMSLGSRECASENTEQERTEHLNSGNFSMS